MSVYTSVNREQLDLFLQPFAVGNLKSHRGIAAGITNSNFWLETDKGSYVLTIFEHEEKRNLDYSLGLQLHLARQNIACASPLLTRHGDFYSILNSKPAALIEVVDGEVCTQPEIWHCSLIGAELAKLHLAGKSFDSYHADPCGPRWRALLCQQLTPHISDSDVSLLQAELTDYLELEKLSLPGGAIHADLFHDNVLFRDRQIAGIIDFEYACDGYWLYDLAIAINDWCIVDDGEFDSVRFWAFVDAYHDVRPLTESEQESFSLMLRLAATRFWLSRLYDKLFPLAGEMTFIKNPDECRDILLLRRDQKITFSNRY